jgi:hypothetical protein
MCAEFARGLGLVVFLVLSARERERTALSSVASVTAECFRSALRAAGAVRLGLRIVFKGTHQVQHEPFVELVAVREPQILYVRFVRAPVRVALLSATFVTAKCSASAQAVMVREYSKSAGQSCCALTLSWGVLCAVPSSKLAQVPRVE